MQDAFDLTTLIFLGLAVFVIWRLRSVLGTKTGHERPPEPVRREPPQGARVPAREGDNVVRLPGAPTARDGTVELAPDRWKGLAEPDSAVAKGLDEIVRAEPAFNGREFMDGAKMAYEMIVMSFAAGDKKALKNLLSREVFEGFEQAINEREKRGEKAETTFVSIDRADIQSVDVRNRVAQVTIRFVSKLITATRDAAGAVVEGSPDTVVDVTDVWTFARTLGSRDPTWHLVATEAGP